MMRTVTKLVPKAKNTALSLTRPWSNETPFRDGSWRFNASNVMANAKTPSLNASILAVSRSSRLSRLSRLMVGGPRPESQTSSRFEFASRWAKRWVPDPKSEPHGEDELRNECLTHSRIKPRSRASVPDHAWRRTYSRIDVFA